MPNCFTQPCANADSVSVLVSEGEFRNMLSMVLAIRGASSGLAMRTIPADLSFDTSGTLSSKYSHWNQNWLVVTSGSP